MKNKAGYLKFPSSFDGHELVTLFKNLRKDLGVKFCITNISQVDDTRIELEIYSDEKSWQQYYFIDGIYSVEILSNEDLINWIN